MSKESKASHLSSVTQSRNPHVTRLEVTFHSSRLQLLTPLYADGVEPSLF